MIIDEELLREMAKGSCQSTGRVRYILRVSPTVEVARMALKMDDLGFYGDLLLDIFYSNGGLSEHGIF